MFTWLITVGSSFVSVICVTPSVPVPGPTDCEVSPLSSMRLKNGVPGTAVVVGLGLNPYW